MKNRVLLTLLLITSVAVSTVAAHGDKTMKKATKSNQTCCSEKASSKNNMECDDMTAKKDGKSCCDTEKVGMKETKEARKMDCCTEHEKTNNEKTKSLETKGTK